MPRDERVLAFGCASLIYTSILSLWNSQRAEGGGEVELCALGESDDECVVIGSPRSRSLLPVGMRTGPDEPET